MNALQVRGVSHSFGPSRALTDVSLAVPRGAFVVLLGPNGAGKSTLFALVTRLYDNVSGEIRILGHDVRRHPTAALRQLGVVFQSRSLDNDLTPAAEPHLSCGAARDWPASTAVAARCEALAKVGLAERAGDKVRALSGGQARRVEIARALLHDPACLLLDEATVGLDVASRESVLAIVRDSRQRARLWACRGPPIWSTRSQPTTMSCCCTRDACASPGRCRSLLEAAQASTLRGAFMRVTENTPPRPHDRLRCSTAPRCRGLFRLLQRHRLARGVALPASARALPLRARAAAGVAVHLRGRLSPGARRIDHSALSNLRSLRGVRHARPGRHGPAVQRHAILALDGLRPRDRRNAHAAGQPVPALLPARLEAARRRGGVAAAGLCLPADRLFLGDRAAARSAISPCCRRSCSPA